MIYLENHLHQEKNMAEIHNTKPIASTRVGDNATVLVMGIHYDEALTCDRKCSVLQPDDDGILICGYDNVKNIVNFQTRALVIEYQCILDRDADENWGVYKQNFKVIDNDGFIHEGDVLCDRILYPIKTVRMATHCIRALEPILSFSIRISRRRRP